MSLARALYADADVYLLDDVLSAVDAHVGRHIVDRVLLDLLGDKTVILASHQLSCLDRAATVVVLKGGAVAFAGTPADCYAADALEGIRGESDDATGAASASREIAPTAPPAPAKVDEERKDDATADAGKLTTAEDRVVGTVSMRVLRSYARLCGTCFVFLVVAFLVLKTAGAVCAQADLRAEGEADDLLASRVDEAHDDRPRLLARHAARSRIDARARVRHGDPLSHNCLLYTSPSPRDKRQSRMPSSA